MSAVFKRSEDDEGIEMPVKETVTREMLSMMLGFDETEVLHIFNSTGEEETVLLLSDSYYIPKASGNFTVKSDADIAKEKESVKIIGANEFAANNFGFWSFMVAPPKKAEKDKSLLSFLLKRPGCEEGVEIPEPIAKEMIRELFGLDEEVELIILNEYGHLVKRLPAKRSLWHKENFFSPESPGVFIAMTGKEYAEATEADDSTTAKAVMKQPSMFQNLPPHLFTQILNSMPTKEFVRLAMTCHEMVEILRMDGVLKHVPFNLNMDLPRENCIFSVTHSDKKRGKGHIHPYYLNALKNFEFERVEAKGNMETREPKHSLLAGCQLIGKHNVQFKTFYSVFNRLPMVVEMLKILQPKRAEIWLARLNYQTRFIQSYGEGFTGSDWPFVVKDELKLVTSDFGYMTEMSRHGGILHFISGLKIFQAFSIYAPTFPVTAHLLREFQTAPEIGKIQMIQLVFPEELKTNVDIFQGIPQHFNDGYQVEILDSLEFWPRIRAGICSDNSERIAIVESRKYHMHRVVTMAFTSFEGYNNQLGRVYKKIEDLLQKVDQFLKR